MYQDIGKEILVGQGQDIHPAPVEGLVEAMERLPERMKQRLAFMTREHHLVRDFVVREMPRQSQPIAPARIAQCTGIAGERVTAIVAELEKNLFFLVRDGEGNAAWAYPVTTYATRHRLTFSTGEKTNGA